MATERELTDAKLEAVEARVETRLTGIEGKIDRLLDRVEASVTAAKEAKSEATLAKTAAGNTKWNILFTGLAVVALAFSGRQNKGTIAWRLAHVPASPIRASAAGRARPHVNRSAEACD